MSAQAQQIRDFWFGKLPLTASALDQRTRLWFGPEAAMARFDATIRTRFGPLLEQAARGELDSWADSPRRCLSLIILFDQFPRNIYRGTAQAYAYDARALGLTLHGMQSAADGALDAVERIFFYMPLQHSEAREVQEESVAAFRRLLNEAPEPLRATFATCLEEARSHQALIERFGRFPQRNFTLGRANTPDEETWLSERKEEE